MSPQQRELLIDYIASYRAELESVDSFFSEKLLYAIIRSTPWRPWEKSLNEFSEIELLECYLSWFDIMPDEYEEDRLVLHLAAQVIFN